MAPSTRSKPASTKAKTVRISKPPAKGKAANPPRGAKSLPSDDAEPASSPAHRHAEPSKPALKATPTVETLKELDAFLSESENEDDSSDEEADAAEAAGAAEGIPSDDDVDEEDLDMLSKQTKERLPKLNKKDKVRRLLIGCPPVADSVCRQPLASSSSVDFLGALRRASSGRTLSNLAKSTGSDYRETAR
jgi:hypothetical protein